MSRVHASTHLDETGRPVFVKDFGCAWIKLSPELTLFTENQLDYLLKLRDVVEQAIAHEEARAKKEVW